MADIRQAKKLISELPTGDPVKALERITFWLDSVSRSEGFKTEFRLELVDLLERAARNHQRKVDQDYLSAQRLQKGVENSLWSSAFGFWQVLSASYYQCVVDFQSGGTSAAIKKQLPVIIARALRALTMQLKWSLRRYGPIEARIWAELGQLYHFAEAQRNAMAAVHVYPGANGTSSAQEEFLKAMMLGVSSMDTLDVLEQDIAGRAVAHFASRYVIRDQVGDGCSFLFDLSMRESPARAHKGARSGGHVRCFGAGDAGVRLAALIAETKHGASVPADLNPGGSYETDLVLKVLEQLALCWSDSPPSRQHERHKITTRITVTHGFGQILKRMVPDTGSDTLDFTGAESWVVDNASASGYGAMIPKVKGDWVRVGTLVGLQTGTADWWGAAIIRRITCDDNRQRRVGIQLLSPVAIAVSISPSTQSSGQIHPTGDRAVLLSTKPDPNGEVMLLLRSGMFRSGQDLEMQVRDNNYLLLPSELVHRGDDFDWAKFAIVQSGSCIPTMPKPGLS